MSSRAQTADLLPAHVHGVYFWAVQSIGRNIMTTKRATFVDALVLAYQTQSTHKYPWSLAYNHRRRSGSWCRCSITAPVLRYLCWGN